MQHHNTGVTAETLLKAIRRHCMECSGGIRREVEHCQMRNCNLHPYRRDLYTYLNSAAQTDIQLPGQTSMFREAKE